MSQSNQDTVRAPLNSGRLYERDDHANCARPLPELSPLARAALSNGVAFDDVYAYCAARPDSLAATRLMSELCEQETQRELDIALFENFHAREPRKSVLFWKEAGL